MNEQDEQKLRQLILEELQSLRAEVTVLHTDNTTLRGEMRDGFTAIRGEIQTLREEFNARLNRAIEAFAANLSDLREELRRRLEHVENNVATILFQTAGMSKSLTDAERLDGRLLDTQSAQQRAIDDLAARVTRLEAHFNPPH